MSPQPSIFSVIMAGGSGTRFWPESRARCPKQLLRLVGERTMIQATLDRLVGLSDWDHCLVVTNRQLVDPIAAQLPGFPRAGLLGEPCKRDTAPCIGLAAYWVRQRDPEGLMLVLPADHLIQTTGRFQAAVRRAVDLIQAYPQRIIAFGIPPTYPSESFGYIERDPEVVSSDGQVFRVRRFREKPDRDTAAAFLRAGGFYWNAGIFVWRADTILEALRQFEPDMHAHLERIGRAFGTSEFEATLDREFAAIKGKSIDYAVLERYSDVWALAAPFDWDDVGQWGALPRFSGADAAGNTVSGLHVGIETRDAIIRGAPDHLIVTVGLSDCIVVQTPDATLIARRQDEEKIREVVKALESRGLGRFL